MQCSHCGCDVVAGQRFCGACGKPLAPQCKNCGEDLIAGARFCTACGHPVEAAKDEARSLAKPSRERRQITVLFADIVGSVAMLQDQELEEFEAVVGSFRAICDEKASALGGTILKFLGDGIMVGFGYPEARENAPACAVECALGITEALQESDRADGAADPPVPEHRRLRARIGIETGLALTGSVAEESRALLGDAPNMAARIQSFADTNKVVVGPTTARIVRDLFDLTSMGPRAIRGRRDPLQLFEVTGIAQGRTLGDRGPRARARFVGRVKEMDLLRALWAASEADRGAAVLLVGEPGIGKSRAVFEFLSDLPRDSLQQISLNCLPHLQTSDLAPLSDYFRRLVKNHDGSDPVQAIVCRAEGTEAPSEQLVAAFRQTFGLAKRGKADGDSVSPELRRRAIEVAQRWFGALAADRPTVVVAEDLHWADEETLQFLKALVARQGDERRFTIMTARPEFTCAWLARLKVHQVLIEGFTIPETRDLIAAHLSVTSVAPSLVSALQGHSGGVPLFIEELLAVLKETARLSVENDQASLRDGSVTGVPTTIMDLIMSRLERLGKARWLAQIAAVAGRQCPTALIATVTGQRLSQLEADIDALLESGLIAERGIGDDAVLEFKHALVQEAAYQTLPRDVRDSYHQKIAEALSEGTDAAGRAHQIAQHYDSAGRPDLAYEYWMDAGKRAVHNSANEEALRHLRSALGTARLRSDLDEAARNKAELSARLAMSAPSIAVHGWSAPAVETQYREAERLSQRVGDSQQSFDVLRGKLNVYLLRGDLARGREAAEAIDRLSREDGSSTARIEALRSLAVCDFLGGNFEDAKRLLLDMRALYSGREHHGIAFRYGSNPFVVGESWRAWALCLTGEKAEADAVVEAAIAEALATDHSFSLCYALCFQASIQQCDDEAAAAEATARRIVELAQRQGYPYWVAWAEIVQGWAIARQGNPEVGSQRTRDGLRGLAQVGARQILGYGLTLLAETLELRPKARLAVMKRAEVSMQRSGIVFYRPALMELMGAVAEEEA